GLHGALPVGDEQITACSVGVDGTIQVTPAVVVVGDAGYEAAAEVALDREVGLLRVGVDEAFGLRIAERLESEREECLRIQVALIDEERIRIEGVEPLLVRLVTECGNGTGQASGGGEDALKNICCVQIRRAIGC